MTTYLMALDQGTTSTRAVIFTSHGELIAQHQLPIQLAYPQNAWIEQDLEEIWQTTVDCIQHVLVKANLQATEVSALGISNQRETTCVWQRTSGKRSILRLFGKIDVQLLNATHYRNKQLVETLQEKTGLLPDLFFSHQTRMDFGQCCRHKGNG